MQKTSSVAMMCYGSERIDVLYILNLGMTTVPIAIGRAVHSIFSFPKEGKEKDAISIPHAIPFSEDAFCVIFNF